MRTSRTRQERRYQKFVGPELAIVLEEVQRAHGPKAQIVSVDRVRQGGVAGFFARESYEVIVDGAGDTDDGPEPRRAVTDAAGGGSARAIAGRGLDPAPGRVPVGASGAGNGWNRQPASGPPPVLSFADLLERRLQDEDFRDLDAHEPAGAAPESEPAAAPALESEPASAPAPDPPSRSGPETGLDPIPETGLDPIPEPPPDHGGGQRLASVDDWTDLGSGHRLVPTRAETGPPARPVAASALEFWAAFDQARSDAELLAVPAVALSAIVGPLPVVESVVGRCQAGHWSGACEVFALTARRPESVPSGWRIVRRTEDMAELMENDVSDFPLLVIDTPPLLPTWLRPLLDRLRVEGLGLVHYVLDGDPSDEDLATWHGEIGRPAVLDVVGTLAPRRVLELLERGEPIASIAGVPVTADLLLALRMEVASR